MQMVARANLIFGLHVHIGIEDRETLIHLMNQLRYFLPHLLALSTNSPFWIGMNTGSSRTAPRCSTGSRHNIPDTVHVVGGLRELRQPAGPHDCIDNAKKIWWDIRPGIPSSPRSRFACATSRCASDEDAGLGRADPGDGGEAVPACTRRTRAGGSTAARCDGKQVASGRATASRAT
jgi:hypothetical protein